MIKTAVKVRGSINSNKYNINSFYYSTGNHTQKKVPIRWFVINSSLYFSFVNQYSLGGGFPFPIVLVLRYKLSLCYTPIKPDLLGFSGIDVFTCGLRVHVTTRFASSSLNLNCFYLILVDILSRLSIPLFFPHFKCIIILHIISLFILKFT
jgi:hypothetical protein